MTEKEYHFRLERDDGRIRTYDYLYKDNNCKCTMPTNNQDKQIIETLETLMDELDLDELKINLNIK